MKIKTLINKLSKLDPDSIVMIQMHDKSEGVNYYGSASQVVDIGDNFVGISAIVESVG